MSLLEPAYKLLYDFWRFSSWSSQLAILSPAVKDWYSFCFGETIDNNNNKIVAGNVKSIYWIDKLSYIFYQELEEEKHLAEYSFHMQNYKRKTASLVFFSCSAWKNFDQIVWCLHAKRFQRLNDKLFFDVQKTFSQKESNRFKKNESIIISYLVKLHMSFKSLEYQVEVWLFHPKTFTSSLETGNRPVRPQAPSLPKNSQLPGELLMWCCCVWKANEETFIHEVLIGLKPH